MILNGIRRVSDPRRFCRLVCLTYCCREAGELIHAQFIDYAMRKTMLHTVKTLGLLLAGLLFVSCDSFAQMQPDEPQIQTSELDRQIRAFLQAEVTAHVSDTSPIGFQLTRIGICCGFSGRLAFTHVSDPDFRFTASNGKISQLKPMPCFPGSPLF